jgi:hypothetical protein
VDIFFPMIYHKFFNWENPALLTASNEGILCSGLFIGHVPADRIPDFIQLTQDLSRCAKSGKCRKPL